MASLSQDLLDKINPKRGEATPPAQPGAPAEPAAPEQPAAQPTQTMTTTPSNTVVLRPDDPRPAAPAAPAEPAGLNDLQGLLNRLTEDPAQPAAPAAPAQPAAPAVAPAEPLPFALPDAAAFTPPATPSVPAQPVAQPAPASETPELQALRDQLSTVTQTLEQQQADAERERNRREREQELENNIRQRFGGDVPENVLQEFGDLLSAARNQVGSELGLEYGRQMLDLQDQVTTLQGQLEAAQQTPAAPASEPAQPSAEDLARQERDLMQTYQQNLAATVPFYSEVMRHPNLQQMLDMPVSPLDPNRTWDMALGELFAGRDTANITRFVDEFHGTYIKTDKRKSRAVPAPNSTGNGAETRHTNTDSNTLSREELNNLYQASMRGELKLTDEQRRKLRKAYATANQAS